MKYSDWQLERLRDALRQWHASEEGFTWLDVREAIEMETGVRIPHERLRQFVVGLDKEKNGNRVFPTLRADRLDAVAAFTTNEDYDLISADELGIYRPRLHAPQRLIEFMGGPRPPRFSPFPHLMDGKFFGSHPEEEGQVSSRTISVRRIRADEVDNAKGFSPYLYVVTEYRKYHESREYRYVGPKAHCLSEIEFEGWAAVAPERSVLFFLRDKKRKRNEVYLSVVVGTNQVEPNQLAVLVLLNFQDKFVSGSSSEFDEKVLANMQKAAQQRVTQGLITLVRQ